MCFQEEGKERGWAFRRTKKTRRMRRDSPSFFDTDDILLLRSQMYDPNVFTLNLEQLLSGAPLGSSFLSISLARESRELTFLSFPSFSLSFPRSLSRADAAIGVLQITLSSARGIKGTKIGGGTPDPYVSLSLAGKAEVAKTRFKPSTYNPQWNEVKFILINSLSDVLALTVYE